MKDWLVKNIIRFLEKNGIDPMYAATIFSILIVLTYRKDLMMWKQLPDWKKGIIGTTFVGTIVFILISLLRLIGLINV